MILPALAGLTAGATHALSEAPDRGPRIGLSWGLGHGLGTVVLSAVALGLRAELDLDSLGTHAEALIGVVLVATGLWALARLRSPAKQGHPVAALGIGTLHGVAGGTTSSWSCPRWRSRCRARLDG